MSASASALAKALHLDDLHKQLTKKLELNKIIGRNQGFFDRAEEIEKLRHEISELYMQIKEVEAFPAGETA